MSAPGRASYVMALRRARAVAERLHLLDRLERSDRRWARHARTMFAIHDVDDLVALGLPWWVYRAAERVDEFLTDTAGKAGQGRVFEYGSGASTVWLAGRAAEVHSVEHHPEFSEFMAKKLADLPHVTLRHVPAVPVRPGQPAILSHRFGSRGLDFTDYVHAIDQVEGEFDLIVIDGRAREACLRRAVPRLAADGLLVFDNSGRRRYQQALRSCGLRIETLRGAAPCLPYPSVTSLLSRPPDRG